MTHRDARLHELDLLWMHYFDALKLSDIVRFEDCERVIDAAFRRGQELSKQLCELDASSAETQARLEERILDLERDLDAERERAHNYEQTIRAERTMFRQAVSAEKLRSDTTQVALLGQIAELADKIKPEPGNVLIEVAAAEYERMRKKLGPDWEWSDMTLTVPGAR